MAGTFRIALISRPRDGQARRAREALSEALDGASVGEPDEQGIFEVEVPASSQDEALQRVWDGVARAGADDHLVFMEHPDLPEHWRHRAEAPGPA